MNYPNIKINYKDTPERFLKTADELISFLIGNLQILNSIEEEVSVKNYKLQNYQQRGIRLKGMPKDNKEIWNLYKTRYGEAASKFCTAELLARGYAQQMNGVSRVFSPEGILIEEKISGQYAYLDYGCELTITMKSNKRALIEIFFIDEDGLTNWRQFTITNVDEWRLADIKQKQHEDDKWRKDNL